MTDNLTIKAVNSIATQFRGGEHVKAGARASELAYGGNKTPNQAIIDDLEAKAPGISRYISAPEAPVTKVSDQGGDPLSKQPENDPNQNFRSNVSTAEAVDEQNAIDERLSAGRDRTDKSEVGETKLNPAGSDKDDRAKPAKAKK